jgi:hypothetical protein
MNNVLAVPNYRFKQAVVLGDTNIYRDGKVLYLPVYAAALI